MRPVPPMEPAETVNPSVRRGDWAFSQLARADVTCPATIGELAAEVAGGRRPFAGATDLLLRSQRSGGTIPPLVWTQSVSELEEVRPAGERLHIGAGASARAIAASPEIRSGAPALAEAALLLGSVQIRTRATVVGNVCNASPAADTVPALAVHGAVVLLRCREEQRTLPLSEFLTGPGTTALRQSEFVVGLELEGLKELEASCYRRFTVRESMDLAFVGVGVKLRVSADARTIERAAIALGAVGPTVERAPEAAAALEGRAPTAEVVRECGELAAAGCHPIGDLRASAAYRRRLVAALVRATVGEAWRRALAAPSG